MNTTEGTFSFIHKSKTGTGFPAKHYFKFHTINGVDIITVDKYILTNEDESFFKDYLTPVKRLNGYALWYQQINIIPDTVRVLFGFTSLCLNLKTN